MNVSFPRIFVVVTILLFGFITMAAWKKNKQKVSSKSQTVKVEESGEDAPSLSENDSLDKDKQSKESSSALLRDSNRRVSLDGVPQEDRIDEFFNVGKPKFPIVETIKYSSYVPWKTSGPAWVVDYASHYKTSRHFIARSLNKRKDYFTQNISNGDYFNILSLDKDFHFYLLVDVSRLKMWFYYVDAVSGEKTLVKSYDVGLGRPDSKSPSGTLTPLGKYQLGNKVGIYKPGVMGTTKEGKFEMITVFGSRWIPFEKELADCTKPAKGYGIHGAPWVFDASNNQWVEDLSTIGQFQSDGCIRLKSEDIEEIFSIIISRNTEIEVVNDYFEIKNL